MQMTVWYNLPTITNRRYALRFAALLALFIALITTLLFADVSRSAPSTNRTINFQGRLLTATGSVVPDGNYNIQFKIYEDGSGAAVNNPDGTLKWTESYVNNGGSSGVFVRNGFFSVSLGSQNPFGSSVDWDKDAIWLSMNIAGRASACTTFGTGPCTADGEMLPMKQITATPYAINAGAVGGKTIDNLLQLAQGVQTDTSTNTSSIFINKTGTGNLIQLQNAAADVFTVTNNGDLVLGNTEDKSISIATSDTDIDGQQLTVSGGAGGAGAGSDGGDLVLQGGSAGGTNGNGGNINIDAGQGTGTGSGGSIAIGTTNAENITIGNVDSTTTIQGNLQTNNIDTDGNEDLNIGSDNASNINLNQNVTVAFGKTLTVNGNTVINPTTDNLNAFQIQNSMNASVLNVSTSSGDILTLGSGNGGMGHVGHVTHGTHSGTASTRSSTILKAVPAGHTLIGSLTQDYGVSLPPLTVTDSRGNIYSVDSTASNSSAANQYIFSGRITTPLRVGDTLTLTTGSSAVRWAWNVEEFDNIVTSNRLDKATGNAGTGTTLSSGTTSASTTHPNELVFSGFGYTASGGRIMSPGSGFSSAPAQATTGGTDRGNFIQWKYVTSTGTQTSTATTNTSSTWAAALATYRTTGTRGIAGSIGFSDASGNTGSINVSKLTQNRTYLLPDEDGTICLQNSESCGFIQDQNSTDQDANFRISGTGSISNNSTSAFQVQSTSGGRKLNVDTINDRVSIGTSDNTGTLLVLDTKTGSGDPAGTNGAMYYNSDAGKFRCYESSNWKDCITPLPVSAVTTADVSNATTTPSDVDNLSFPLAANTKYYYKFVIIHQSPATSTGIGFGITAPTAPTTSNWCVNTTATLSSATAGNWGAYCGTNDASHTTSGVQTSATNYTSTMEGYIQTSTNAGPLKLRMKSGSAATTTVKAGSFGILQVVQ